MPSHPQGGWTCTKSEDSIYWLAVLAIGREDEQHGVTRPSAEALSALIGQLETNGFTRIFVLDCCNEQALNVTAGDQHFLIALFLQFLVRYASCGEAASYAEWLLNESGRERMLTGISALSLHFPVEQVLELASLYRGAEAWSALRLTNPEEHEQFYVDSFLLRAGQVSWDEVQRTVSTRGRLRFNGPLRSESGHGGRQCAGPPGQPRSPKRPSPGCRRD